jgi:2-methylisocitrate lyase-like PEP mutase family enzyme
MTAEQQSRQAEAFRALHRTTPPLLLPNAWDAMSARLLEDAGFEAVATTSGGLAWALGMPDGEHAPWPEVLAATARIARTVRVPVTADIEAGYGDTPDEVGRSVAAIIAAGAVGINLEDSLLRGEVPLRTVEDAAARITAAREAARASGIAIVINARVDVYLKKVGEPETRLAETVKRASAYLAAGADCIFPFAVSDPDTIAALARAIGAPINVVGRAGMPDLAALGRLGVARVSTASGLTLTAMSALREVAAELRRSGSFEALHPALKHPEAQRLFGPRGG